MPTMFLNSCKKWQAFLHTSLKLECWNEWICRWKYTYPLFCHYDALYEWMKKRKRDAKIEWGEVRWSWRQIHFAFILAHQTCDSKRCWCFTLKRDMTVIKLRKNVQSDFIVWRVGYSMYCIWVYARLHANDVLQHTQCQSIKSVHGLNISRLTCFSLYTQARMHVLIKKHPK